MASTQRSVSAVLGDRPYAVQLSARGIVFNADEPKEDGGGDTGPRPHEHLLASLAACTAITLRMYADRKGWPVDGLEVIADMERKQEGREVDTRIRVSFKWPTALSLEQTKRMAQVAAACPVHRTLTGKLQISVELGEVI